MLVDTADLRAILCAHYSGLLITDVALKSGQRIVYFGEFSDFERLEAEDTILYDWSKWKKVAIKISDGTSSSDIARMQNEISALVEISSPYYPKLYHFELLSFNPITEEPLKPKLFVTVEEYIDSIPLSACLENYGTETKIVGLMISLLKALKILWDHQKRYVHRDIKPANILIKADGEIVIIDLGIIRESGSVGLTNTHLPVGPCTPGYASPEQLKNDKKNITFKSDCFSLGVLCYTLLSGSNPFYSDGDGWHDIFEKTLNYDPEPLHQYGVCSSELSEIVQKLIHKQPYKRYRDISSLINKLEKHKEKIDGN